ncbi:MAG: hypothetical protein M0C28_23590 [Candidatus Moduliflexus flocculans]|nr:hypothetical protein [Candidatus Moduliflexus flocculans]
MDRVGRRDHHRVEFRGLDQVLPPVEGLRYLEASGELLDLLAIQAGCGGQRRIRGLENPPGMVGRDIPRADDPDPQAAHDVTSVGQSDPVFQDLPDGLRDLFEVLLRAQ